MSGPALDRLVALFGDYNRSDVLFLGDWRPWQLALFGLAAAGVCALTWLDARDLSRARAAALVGLRAVALGLAILLLLEPALELRRVSVVPNHVAVMIDTSQSQALPTAAAGTSRFARAQAAARAAGDALDRAGGAHVASWYAVSADARVTVPEAEHTPAGDATHLIEAIREFATQHAPPSIGGVVIISDGIDTGELGTRTPRGAALDDESLRLLTSLGAPVHTIATAAEGEVRDVAVQRVIVDDFAFVRNVVSVTARLTLLGFDGPVEATLRRDGAPLQTRVVSPAPGASDVAFEFEFVPERLGNEVYTVDTPLRDGEAIAENNQKHFVLKVIRDKIRVLQVVGRPSWDVRFLRQLLQNNPNVDLVNFFILRTQEDMHRGSDSELSLIPFPTDELFDEQLGGFDLVIFQNFNFEPYDMRRYLPRIRDYVLGGGGFAMIGGDLSFASGGYAETEIADVLPVRLPRGGAAAIDGARFRPVLTDAGQRHPITRLEFDPVRNRALWESLPQMTGTNVVLDAIPAGVVLATHPSARAPGGPMPVLAVADIGRGRAMALTIDGAWRWSFERVGRGEGSGPYASFWSSAIRWLIRDPELNLVEITIPREVYDPAQPRAAAMDAAIRVFEADYRPAVHATGSATLTRRALAGDAAPEVVVEAPVTTDEAGRATFSYVVDRPGAYTLSVEIPQPEGPPLTDSEVFLGVTDAAELRDIEPRPDLLRAIAEVTGGVHVAAGRGVGALPFLPPKVEAVDDREVIDAWSTPWLLLVFVALLGTEWSLRRRWGRL